MKILILSSIFLVFIGCGSERASSSPTLEQNGPKSPQVTEKEKVPPSIPNI